MALDMRAWKWCGGKIVSVQYSLTKKIGETFEFGYV